MKKKFKTSKWFRVGVSGKTVDGRVIKPEWIDEMAATYSPVKYGARVNMEHLKSVMPDGPFRAFGDVLALKAEDMEIDGEKRRALYAQIDPTEDLVAMNKKRQKVYSSMEIGPNFAGSGKCYLRGLAVTDDPASLGTEMLEFSARGIIFSAAEETEFVFEEETLEPGLLDKIKGMFARKQDNDDERFSDVHAAVEEIATHQVELSDKTNERVSKVEVAVEKLNATTADVASLKTQVDDIVAKLSATPAGTTRAPATGGKGEVVTDC